MSAFVRALAILAAAGTLWGCAAQQPIDETRQDGGSQGVQTTEPAKQQTGENVQIGKAEQGGGFTADPLTDPGNPLYNKVVYFDFDESRIKPEARATIEAHAKHLVKNPHLRITLEGHCDERGTREYNLGLGERRAKAVQQMMSLMGVQARQVELVSYGEERPADLGHDEMAWSKNRRTEIIYR